MYAHRPLKRPDWRSQKWPVCQIVLVPIQGTNQGRTFHMWPYFVPEIGGHGHAFGHVYHAYPAVVPGSTYIDMI